MRHPFQYYEHKYQQQMQAQQQMQIHEFQDKHQNFDLQTLILLIKTLEKIYPSVTIKSQAEASVVLNWKLITSIMSQEYLDLNLHVKIQLFKIDPKIFNWIKNILI